MTEQKKLDLTDKSIQELHDFLKSKPLSLGPGPHTAECSPMHRNLVDVKDRNGTVRATMHKEDWDALVLHATAGASEEKPALRKFLEGEASAAEAEAAVEAAMGNITVHEAAKGIERLRSIERTILGECEHGCFSPPTSHRLMEEMAADYDKGQAALKLVEAAKELISTEGLRGTVMTLSMHGLTPGAVKLKKLLDLLEGV